MKGAKRMLAVFDIGGTAVKHGLFNNEKLSQVAQFPTPKTFELLQEKMRQIITQSESVIEGVAISAPGAVNVKARRIDGISAVPYLHHRPIYDELTAYLGLPVTIENDANCAGICEIEIGAARHVQHAAFVVIGTGVGGALFIHRKLYQGAHLFGGELGFMRGSSQKILSENGTVVKAAKKYSKLKETEVNGQQLFALKENGDLLAQEILADMYQKIVEMLYNLQVSFDPEVVVIGGGISARPEVAEELATRLKKLLQQEGIEEIMPEIKCCEYQNNANLLGTALNYQKQRQK